MLLVNHLCGFGVGDYTPPLTYPTLDPSNKSSNMTLSGGNLTATGPSGSPNYSAVLATASKSTGKWYFEVTVTTVGTSVIGVSNVAGLNGTTDNRAGDDATTFGYKQDGNKWSAGSGAAYGATYTNGNIIGVAFDATNGKIFFSKDGTWQNSGDPAAGTNAAFTGLSGTKYPMCLVYQSGVHVINFGASAFSNSPPSGFSAFSV